MALSPSAWAFLFYNGYLNVALDKGSVDAGGALRGTIEVGNFEDVAFNDAYIVLEVVSGGKDALGYPSQLGDEGTIISETKIGARLAAGGQKKIPFEIALPKGLKGGIYTLDAYYAANRAPVVGIAHIFISPASTQFTVNGNGEFPQLGIVRTKTTFNGVAGPVGPPIEGGKIIEGRVFVKNLSAKGIEGATVWTGLCMWDDTSSGCDSFLSEDSKKADFPAGKETEVGLALKAPELSGAYAIRIEVRDMDNRMVSLYRNRAIVVGPTARIKKLDISTQKLEPGRGATISLLLGSSPDHYTNPDFNDFNVKVWAEEKSGGMIFEKAVRIGSLGLAELEREMSFGFVPEKEEDAFKVCSEVEKGGTIFDRYCLDVEGLDIDPKPAAKAGIDVNTSYNPATGAFSATVCGTGEDGGAEGLDIGMLLFEQETGAKIIDSEYIGDGCYTDTVNLKPMKHILVVDDFKNAGQFSKELDFSAPALPPICNGIGGTLCAEGEKCGGTVLAARERGVCCSNGCGAASGGGITVEADAPSNERLGTYAIAGVAAIALIIVLFFVLEGAKKDWEGQE